MVGRAWVSVARGDLDIAEIYSSVEHPAARRAARPAQCRGELTLTLGEAAQL
jgi:hypothetical protein